MSRNQTCTENLHAVPIADVSFRCGSSSDCKVQPGLKLFATCSLMPA